MFQRHLIEIAYNMSSCKNGKVFSGKTTTPVQTTLAFRAVSPRTVLVM
jgi:hypothetical protein